MRISLFTNAILKGGFSVEKKQPIRLLIHVHEKVVSQHPQRCDVLQEEQQDSRASFLKEKRVQWLRKMLAF